MSDVGLFVMSVGLLSLCAVSFIGGYRSGHAAADAAHGWQHDSELDAALDAIPPLDASMLPARHDEDHTSAHPVIRRW